MSEDMNGVSSFLVTGFRNDCLSVSSDPSTKLSVLVRNPLRFCFCRLSFLMRVFDRGELVEHSVDRPSQIRCGGPRRFEFFGKANQVLIKGFVSRLKGRQVHPEACGRSNQAGTPNLHFLNRDTSIFHGSQVHGFKAVREGKLVYDTNDAIVRRTQPNRTVACIFYLQSKLEPDSEACPQSPTFVNVRSFRTEVIALNTADDLKVFSAKVIIKTKVEAMVVVAPAAVQVQSGVPGSCQRNIAAVQF
jgi:hypothetical protein